MENQYEKLKNILKQMFQLDQADLDFGIYRIMNRKRDEIERFLDNDLLPQVKQEFSRYKSIEAKEKQRELERLEKTLKDARVDPDTNPKVMEIREAMVSYGDAEALANEVFSHLTTFFRRYYDNGDFMSLRRYKKDTYAIPYEGEEVKLHWANSDQYYIKSSEYLKDYAFKLEADKRVHFKLVNATEEKDNVKQEQGKERKFKLYEEEPFKLYEEEPFRIDGNELYIQFTYLPDKIKQTELNKKTLEDCGKSGELNNFNDIFIKWPTAKNPNRTLLEKHLNDYTARFNFDFFIHKDLGGFLRRELDFYIKNEVLFIDDLDEQDEKQVMQSIGKIKVIKHIAIKIITFLAQLEDFQKKLWLKKKFVVNCGYCVTLDRVPEALYKNIVRNDAQRKEWVNLFAINKIEKDLLNPGYSKPITVEFLKANPYLVMDTKFFDDEFKEKLLKSLDNIDEACDGVIINSENFQALRLLENKYQEKIKSVYIDPPYNTAASEIVYKNDYKNSSWLTLMHNRLSVSDRLRNICAPLMIAIDEYELVELCTMLDSKYNKACRELIAINHHPQGGKGKHIAYTHEYMIVHIPEVTSAFSREVSSECEEERSFMRSGTAESNYRYARPNSFFAILVDFHTSRVVGIEEPPRTGYKYPTDDTDGGLLRIYPLSRDGTERVWRNAYETTKGMVDKGKLICKNSKTIYQVIRNEDKRAAIFSNWTASKYNAGPNGTNLISDILGESNLFPYPKSIFTVQDALLMADGNVGNDYVLDYFAGSGTTAHAVINLNREDNGKRKYILVEMGQYFDTVLKPRIQKVVYSKDWKGGKPISREGISHMFKYMKLESYEDTLDNLIVKRDKKQEQTLLKMSKSAKEEYMLRYMLDVETRGSDSLLNIDKFEDPFNYTLNIRNDDELKETSVDLVETFNYLIGLYVEQMETIRGFKVIRGRLRTGEKTLVIWRNIKKSPNDKLDNFFLKQKYNTQDFEFDKIFVNGDNNLENLKIEEDKWKVTLIEEEFKKRMFDVKDI
ncbi:MAG: DNA methyltransferase [Candidatus Anammoxibacter sp.]